MDYRKALVVALIIIAISILGISGNVPDDVVYTEIKKTLVNGTKGVLTCLFKGAPHAVYWKKGSSPDDAPSVMTWSYGNKFGPRYEDGSCDIDENYSLIIKHVTHEDEGRYICRVSTYKGVLKYNFTDVTVTDIAVKTEPKVSVQRGKTSVLPCNVLISPRKVSWGKGINSTLVTKDVSDGVINISGTGHEEGLFNMTKNYSLVISDVTLQHGDNYFCEVTEFYTDRIYRDLTVLAVYVPPTLPYPTIEGCPLDDLTNCIITTGSSITLTCHVNEYYPDIDLFFLHGSKRVESIDTKTWNNTDGTKNKTTTISADKSKDLFKCIASGIPGLAKNDEVPATVRLIEKQRNSLIFIVILVPIAICLTVILLTWMRLRKRGRRLAAPVKEIYMEGFMEGHVSYVELWTLVDNAFGNHEEHKLDDILPALNGNEMSQINESQANMDKDYYYKKLCEWKETCDQTINQMTELKDKCSQTGLEDSFSEVEEFRKPTSTEIPSCDLEHILWQIGDNQEITVFLSTLGMDMQGETLSLSRKRFIQEAINQLVSWTKGYLPFDAVVILSSALEKLGHRRADDNFFQIPAQMKGNIDNQELQNFVRKIGRKELMKKFIESIKHGSKIMLTKTLDEDGEVLFNTEKMLLDWWEESECSNYEKRLILEQVLNGNSNNIKQPVVKETIDHHLSDEELKLIARYLNSQSLASVCDKLHIVSLSEDADDEKHRFEVLCQWRTSMVEKEWTSVYGQLRSALEEVGILGILPPLRSDPVHKAEHVDIAYYLLMTNVLPVAKALGIGVHKLSTYRPVLESSHLERGTIGLVARLVESLNKDNSRQIMCSRLREAGFPISVTLRILVYPVRYGELYAISDAMIDAMMDDDCKQGVKCNDEEKLPGEGDSLLSGNDSTPKNIETFAEKPPSEEHKSERYLRDIKKMLKLTDEKVTEHPLLQTEPLDEFTLFKVWKERPHLAVFNERADIIQGLIDIDRPEIAKSVVEGKYHTTDVSLRFINHIVTRMHEKELRNFVDTFGLQKEFEKAHGLDNVCQIIHDFLKSEKDQPSFLIWNKSKGFWDFIDKLVANGFLDIGRELIIIHK